MSTLAEQVVEQLKTDMDNVYDAGYQKGKSEGGETTLDNARFATTLQYADLNLFGVPKVTIKADSLTSMANLFQANVLNTTVEELEVFCEKEITSINNFASAAFAQTENALKRIILHTDTRLCKSFSGVFWKQANLEEVCGTPLDFTSCTTLSLWVSNCPNLREIRAKENTISINIDLSSPNYLSNESVQSFIDGLVDMTGQATKTITLSSSVKAKLTEEQIATITSKNWTLA